jgi:hypothetical protein
MRFSLVQAVINRSWNALYCGQKFTINRANPGNTATLATITIPNNVYYNAIELRSALQSLMPSGWTVTYNKNTNRMTFTRPPTTPSVDILEIDFPSDGSSRELALAMGFDDVSDVIWFTSAAPSFTSTRSMLVDSVLSVDLCTNLPRTSYCSVNSSYYDLQPLESPIFARIPVTAEPFSNFIFTESDAKFSQDVYSMDGFEVLSVFLVDSTSGKVLDSLAADWSFVIRMEHVPLRDSTRDVMVDTLKEMRDYAVLNSLHNLK